MPGELVARPPVQVRTLAKTTRSWDDRLLPRYPRGQPEITILRITIPPGTALPIHKHPVINAAVLLRGELTIFLEDGRRKNLRAGQAVVEVVERWHYGQATGRVPAELIVFYAGAEGHPITVPKNRASAGSVSAPPTKKPPRTPNPGP